MTAEYKIKYRVAMVNAILKLAKEKLLTQEELSQKIGYSESSLRRAKKGEIGFSYDVIISASLALDTTPLNLARLALKEMEDTQ